MKTIDIHNYPNDISLLDMADMMRDYHKEVVEALEEQVEALEERLEMKEQENREKDEEIDRLRRDNVSLRLTGKVDEDV